MDTFGLIAHSSELCDSVNRALSSEPDLAMDYRVVPLGAEIPVAEEMLASGIQAIFCYGGTSQALLRTIGHSLAIIRRSELDIVSALFRAAEFSPHIALSADYREGLNIPLMERLTGLSIHHIGYHNWDELIQSIEQACSAGICTVVGGGLSCGCMQRLGGRGIVVEPSAGAIRGALEQARAIARRKREEVNRQADLLAVLSRLDEGVISVAEDGTPLFCNPRAARLLRLPRETDLNILRRYYRSLGVEKALRGEGWLDGLVRINGEALVASTLPLPYHTGSPGVLVLFRDVTSVQNADRKVRSALYDRGFISRYSVADIKGESVSIRRLVNRILRYAPTDASVHIHGETGTGKELTAHALHAASARAKKSFVSLNCSALPESLLESELFGYEEGAFTGARKGGKAGLFEMADKGTLFLDEIGEISHAVQVRLLRVLEAGEVMRVGGSRVIPIDVRIISASHKDLGMLMTSGRFRADLYYRLVVLRLQQPPLRQRLEDIPLLISPVLERYAKPASCISPAMYETLASEPWPGNIRELRALVESYCILLSDNRAQPDLLSELLAEKRIQQPYPAGSDQESQRKERGLKTLVADFRRQVALATLDACDRDHRQAARRLGISYNTLWRILAEQDDGTDK